jgi:serine/threonine protein phosphatase PrpC
MEDRDVAIERDVADRVVRFFGVYDGHGGAEVADVAADRLGNAFFAALASGLRAAPALTQAYGDVAVAAGAYAHVGSTACTAALIDDELTIVWLGDTQLVVVTADELRFVSTPHRLDDGEEHARIVGTGAAIEGPYVVRGDHGLMVTRAFGDTWFHPAGLIATPSTATVTLAPSVPQLVVVATDGLWDVLRPHAVLELFRTGVGGAIDYARTLVDLALAARTRDNVTVIAAEWVGR